MNVLFTICGRSGSKGMKNKNLKLMKGIPLIYYTLAAIKLYKEKHPDVNVDVALNTDSLELVEQVQIQNSITNICFVERKEKLAGDKIAKVDVIKDCFMQCKENASYDVIVDLDLTSPMRRVKDIEAAITTLLENKNVDLVYSVVPGRRSPYFNMVEKDGNYYKKICSSEFTARQQTPKVYELNASIYAYNPEFLSSEIKKTILEYRGKLIEMPDYLVLDIDSEEDFEIMEYVMDYFLCKDLELKEVTDIAANIKFQKAYSHREERVK